jgi:uridine kinase
VKIYVHADWRTINPSYEKRYRWAWCDMHEVINRYQNTLKPMHEHLLNQQKLFMISLYQTTIQHRSHRCGSSSNKPKFYKLVVILKHTIIRAIRFRCNLLVSPLVSITY